MGSYCSGYNILTMEGIKMTLFCLKKHNYNYMIYGCSVWQPYKLFNKTVLIYITKFILDSKKKKNIPTIRDILYTIIVFHDLKNISKVLVNSRKWRSLSWLCVPINYATWWKCSCITMWSYFQLSLGTNCFYNHYILKIWCQMGDIMQRVFPCLFKWSYQILVKIL